MRIKPLLSVVILIIHFMDFLTKYLGKNKNGIKIFTIDLNLPPEKRFTESSLEFKDEAISLINRYLNEIPQTLHFLIKPIAGIFWNLHPEYYQEIKGIAFDLNLDYKTLMLYHYAYEFSAFCTSVISKDKNGKIIHSRNLDFTYSDSMRNITYEAIFIKDEKEVFRSVMYAGLNSVFTGKAKGFSISLNERRPSIRTDIFSLALNLFDIFYGMHQVSSVIRDTLQECENYQCALNKLSTQGQIAPSYYALAGTKENEGVIISKGRYKTDHLDFLDQNTWYVMQANDDHWTGVCNERCSYVKETMNQFGQENINKDLITNMLKGWPSNNLRSIYNTLIVNSDDIFETQLIGNDKPAPR